MDQTSFEMDVEDIVRYSIISAKKAKEITDQKSMFFFLNCLLPSDLDKLKEFSNKIDEMILVEKLLEICDAFELEILENLILKFIIKNSDLIFSMADYFKLSYKNLRQISFEEDILSDYEINDDYLSLLRDFVKRYLGFMRDKNYGQVISTFNNIEHLLKITSELDTDLISSCSSKNLYDLIKYFNISFQIREYDELNPPYQSEKDLRMVDMCKPDLRISGISKSSIISYMRKLMNLFEEDDFDLEEDDLQTVKFKFSLLNKGVFKEPLMESLLFTTENQNLDKKAKREKKIPRHKIISYVNFGSIDDYVCKSSKRRIFVYDSDEDQNE